MQKTQQVIIKPDLRCLNAIWDWVYWTSVSSSSL